MWQADLDAFGELRTLTIIRLLQEAATRASSAAGFDSAYYARTGSMWLVRRTRLTLAEPARYGDELTVRTWIADFRRVRSQREYEVYARERPIARAASDWVFVDGASGRPRRIPPEWEAVFGVGGAVGSLREPFPEATPPAQCLTSSRRIELHELDALRHVNNSNYVAYIEQALYDYAAQAGCDLGAQIAAGGRLRPVAHDLEYLDAALFGETISASTWVAEVAGNDVQQHTHLHRGDTHKPLLQARSTYRWTSDAGAPFPPAFAEALRAPDLRG